MRGAPPLVHSGEIGALKRDIAAAARGERFLLQAGDCAERFIDCQPQIVADKLKMLLQMGFILADGSGLPVTRIGRIAGQYAKPRTEEYETQDGLTLPSYRGDIINGFAFDAEGRRPDPRRMVTAYQHSCATLNWLRALLAGGLADPRHPELWRLEGERTQLPEAFLAVAERSRRSLDLGRALEFQQAGAAAPGCYVSHEALFLDYERSLTHPCPEAGRWMNLGAHFLWLGERTRHLTGAHAEYLRGIGNPVGIKIGPNADADELIRLLERLDPAGEPGKIVLITRFGAQAVESALLPFVRTVKASGRPVAWSCDPMHGNIMRTAHGIKTRDFSSILRELAVSHEVHRAAGSRLAGMHLEITPEDVTECVGGAQRIQEDDLSDNYQSYCDPRLNYVQSLELASAFAAKLAQRPS